MDSYQTSPLRLKQVYLFPYLLRGSNAEDCFLGSTSVSTWVTLGKLLNLFVYLL